MSIIQGAAHTSVGGYQISRSLRFNSADSAYLNRTLGTPTNGRIFTFSVWFKRSTLSTLQSIMTAQSGAAEDSFAFLSGDTIRLYFSAYSTTGLITNAVFRDVSAWYHIVLAVDTTQATASNRVKMYVNGVQQTFTGSDYPSQNATPFFNTALQHFIGRYANQTMPTGNFNGYLTEVNFIDGQALTPSSFGQTNAQTGVWEPKAYTGTYGTNGFFLKFADNSNTTAATLGKDSSGNGNNWTPNNFSVTAGAGNDSFVDTPTSYGSDTGVGGEVRGNYATLNPLAIKLGAGGTITVTNGNLDTSDAATTYGYVPATMAVSSGKWYWEVFVTSQSNSTCEIGIKRNTDSDLNNGNGVAGTANSYAYVSSGSKRNNTLSTTYGASWTTNDVISVALDMDAGTLVFYKNGSSQGTAYSSLSGEYFPAFGDFANAGQFNYACNFGQRPFAYTAPSGFKALCTQNLPTPTIGATSTTQAGRYFDIELYTGTGSSRSVTGSPFQPDFVWIKGRSGATDHALYDAVRGVQLDLVSNSTAAETTQSTGLTAFNSDGFTVGSLAKANTNTATYVSWLWNAGGSNATNTSGTITSTVRANTTAGFSIVTYTGTGANATVGHGLGVAPSMVIAKNRSISASWSVYHVSLGGTQYLYLNATTAAASGSTVWNNTAPTSTVFSLGTDNNANGSGNLEVAYVFAPVAGYSAFGSYTGNGSSDGPFVFTNHRPAFLLVKRTDSTSDWTILDFQREGYNVDNDPLYPNLSNAEGTADLADLLSNGFKLRSTDTSVNANTGTYIYMSLASNPFKYSLAR